MKKIAQLIAVMLILAVTVINTSSVHAQSTGLGVAPRKTFSLEPGKSISDQLTINNLNKSVALKVTLDVIDFKSSGETGTPALQLNANASPTPWSLKPFITLPQSFEVGPGESKNIPYTIKIPEGQGAGSYYSAIRYSARSAEGQTVTLTASAATLAFVTVPGRATELMNLKQFGTYEIKSNQVDGKFKSLFVSTKPQKLAYLVENVGNVAEAPAGSIMIKNIFGKQVKFIKNANPNNNLALIGQTRRFEVCIDSQTKEIDVNGQKTPTVSCKTPDLFPGMYRAQLNTFYGINGSNTQEINTTAIFWYLPMWFVGVVLVILAIIAYLIVKVRNSLIGTTSHRRGDRSGKRFPFRLKR